jgi:hypothetical protein
VVEEDLVVAMEQTALHQLQVLETHTLVWMQENLEVIMVVVLVAQLRTMIRLLVELMD